MGISFVSGQTTVVVPVAVVVVVTTAVVTCVVPTDGVAVADSVVVTVGVVVVTTVPVVETVDTVVVDGVVVPAVVVVGVTIVVVSALKQPSMFGLTLYRSMVSSAGCNSTIVTSLACVGTDSVGKTTFPSGLTGRSSNVVVLPSADVKITVTSCTLLLRPRDTPVTCGAESALAPLRSKTIVGFFPSLLAGGLTIHFEPSYGLSSTEELSVVVLTCLSGMSGLLPSSPMTFCSGQRTVVVVPAVVALVVTVARVVVVVVGGTVAAVGGVEVDAVEPAGVVAVTLVVVVPWAVVIPSAVVVVAAAVVVAARGWKHPTRVTVVS